MGATIYYEMDADRSVIAEKTVAVIGYGSQGHAHALNLKESGIDVCIGLREGSSSKAKAEEAGLTVKSIADASNEADIVMMLVPDQLAAQIFQDEVAPNLQPGNALAFAHGFNIRYGFIQPPEGVDVIMIAPKGPGHLVRRTYEGGGGIPCLMAVEQDATGLAGQLTLAYADAIGGTRAGVIETTFTEETETDLFGEQVVLCGGLHELILNAYNTLVGAGYQSEIVYFEVLHELKLIVDLIYEQGLGGMFFSISETAEYGAMSRGSQVVGDTSVDNMAVVLGNIKSGAFAEEWMEEANGDRARFDAMRAAINNHPIEAVGRELRAMMPWINAGKQSVQDASGGADNTVVGDSELEQLTPEDEAIIDADLATMAV